MERHVDLCAAIVESYGFGFVNKIAIEFFFAYEVKDRLPNVRIRHHRATLDGVRGPFTVDLDRFDFSVTDNDRRSVAIDTDIDATLYELRLHLLNELVGAALKSKDALRHEVREDNAIADGGVFEGAAIGVGDRLHQQANHVLAPGEELVEQLPRGGGLVVIKVHAARFVEKGNHLFLCHAKLLDQLPSKVLARKTRPQRKHRIIEPYAVELYDRVGNLLGPITAARLHHAVRKTMQRDVEDMPAGPLEPRRHAPELVMLLDESSTLRPCRARMFAEVRPARPLPMTMTS